MPYRKEKTVQDRGSVAEDEVAVLRALSHAAFQRQGLTGHKFEIGTCQLDADPTDLGLGVAWRSIVYFLQFNESNGTNFLDDLIVGLVLSE